MWKTGEFYHCDSVICWVPTVVPASSRWPLGEALQLWLCSLLTHTALSQSWLSIPQPRSLVQGVNLSMAYSLITGKVDHIGRQLVIGFTCTWLAGLNEKRYWKSSCIYQYCIFPHLRIVICTRLFLSGDGVSPWPGTSDFLDVWSGSTRYLPIWDNKCVLLILAFLHGF